MSMEQNAMPSSGIVYKATVPNCYSLRSSDVADWMLAEAVDDMEIIFLRSVAIIEII